MKIVILATCACLIFCLGGCSATNDLPIVLPEAEGSVTPLAQETDTPLSHATPTPVPSRTATKTPVPPTPTPSIPPEARLQIREVDLFDTFPEDYQGEGYIVIYPFLEDVVYIIDLATLEKTKFVPQSQFVRDELGRLSPDEQWLIRLKNLDLKEPEDEVLEVISNQGKVQGTFTLPWEWVLRDTWVSNQTILADKQAEPDVLVYQTMAINPLTGQKRLLPFDYPNTYRWFSMHLYDYNVYDPTLNYVVYPEVTYLSLRDVEKQKNIASISGFSREPVWSPDGSMFAVSEMSNIYGVWLDGTIKPLSHLDKYKRESIGSEGERLRWSPDGQKIAFGMVPFAEAIDSYCLAVLDVPSEAVTDYCIPGYTVWSQLTSYPMIWSPDGRRLLVEAVKNPRGVSDPHILMVDLEKNIAVDLGEKVEPLYFISSLPAVWSE